MSTATFNEILDEMEEAEDSGSGDIKVADLMEKLNSKGYGPMLFVPALIMLLPTGAIPGVPIICGLIIILLCVQIIMQRHTPWLPKRIENMQISEEKLDRGIDMSRPYAKKIDNYTSERFTFMTSHTALSIICIPCILLAGLTVPLEAIPFAASIPAVALCVIALGVSVNDGLLLLIGTVLSTIALIACYLLLAS